MKKMESEMETPYNSEVLFDAPKLFWRTRNTMDVMLVEHFADNAIEVIAYEPSFDKEAPRLYVNNDVLLSILDTATVERKFDERKEQIIRRHITPDNETVRLDVLKTMKVEFLLARMVVDEFILQEHKVTVTLQITHLDSHAQTMAKTSLHKDKPTGVRRHRSPHFKPLMEGAVDAMLEKLATEHASIDQLCEEAIGRTAAAQENVLSAQELWRVPLVYSKKLRGRRLSSEDEQTWRALARRVIRGLPTEANALTAIGEALHKPMEEDAETEGEGDANSSLAVSPSAATAAPSRRIRSGLESQTVASQLKTNTLIAGKDKNKAVLSRGRTAPRLVANKSAEHVHSKSFISAGDNEEEITTADEVMSFAPPPSHQLLHRGTSGGTSSPAVAPSRAVSLHRAPSAQSVSGTMSGIGNMLRRLPSSLGLLASGEGTGSDKQLHGQSGSSKQQKPPALSRTGSILHSLLPTSLRGSFFAPLEDENAHQPQPPVVLHPSSRGSEKSAMNAGESVATTTEVWFQGPKLFWKTKNTSDVLIVHHCTSPSHSAEDPDENGVVELIVYEPSLDREAPRLYASDAALSARLDQSEIASKLVQEREAVLRRHAIPDTAQLLQKIVRQAKLDYLLNRLVITEFEIATKGFTVGLQCTYRDAEGGMSGTAKLLFDQRPAGLRRYRTFQPTGVPGGFPAMRGVVSSLLAMLSADRRALHDDLDRAEGLQIKSRASLSVGEKWRIPLIYRRVATGKPLSDRDAAVWHALSDSIKLNAATDAQQKGIQGGPGCVNESDDEDEGLAFGIADAKGATVKSVPRPRPALHLPKFVPGTSNTVSSTSVNPPKKSASTAGDAASSLPMASSTPSTPGSSRPSSRNNSFRRMSTGPGAAGNASNSTHTSLVNSAPASIKKISVGHGTHHPHTHTHGNKRGSAMTPKRRNLDSTSSSSTSVSFDLQQTCTADSTALLESEGKDRPDLVPLSRVGSIDDEVTVSYHGGNSASGGMSVDKANSTSVDSKDETREVPSAPKNTPKVGIQTRKKASPSTSTGASSSRRGSLTFDLLQAVLSKLTLPFTSSQKVKVYSAAPSANDEETQ